MLVVLERQNFNHGKIKTPFFLPSPNYPSTHVPSRHSFFLCLFPVLLGPSYATSHFKSSHSGDDPTQEASSSPSLYVAALTYPPPSSSSSSSSPSSSSSAPASEGIGTGAGTGDGAAGNNATSYSEEITRNLAAQGVLLPVCLSKNTAELAQAMQLSLTDVVPENKSGSAAGAAGAADGAAATTTCSAPTTMGTASSSGENNNSHSAIPPCIPGTLIALSGQRPGCVQVSARLHVCMHVRFVRVVGAIHSSASTIARFSLRAHLHWRLDDSYFCRIEIYATHDCMCACHSGCMDEWSNFMGSND